MIKKLSITNYKSIKTLGIETTRINVFIGEHNSGKSNILEALSWFSTNALESVDVFREMFRFKTATDFFYDFDATKSIHIRTDDLSMFIRYAKNKNGALLNQFEGLVYSENQGIDPDKIEIHDLKGLKEYFAFQLPYDGSLSVISGSFNLLQSRFRTYIFKKLKKHFKIILARF